MQCSVSLVKLAIVSIITVLVSFGQQVHADSSAGQQAFELGQSLEKLNKQDEALNAYKLACDLAHGRGCYAAGNLHSMSGPFASDALAKEFARRACELDNEAGCGLYARRYDTTAGQYADYTIARSALKKACELGDNQINCKEYANYLEAGLGGAKDWKAARQVLERVCQKTRGNQPACLDLARFLGSGFGGPRDQDRQVELLKKACDANLAAACAELGDLTNYGVVIWDETGNAVERFVITPNTEQAVALYEKACSLNNYFGQQERGCARLAIHLAAGDGVVADMGRALQLTVDGCEATFQPWLCWGATQTLSLAISSGFFDESEASAVSEKALKMAERGCSTTSFSIEEYERRSGILASCAEADYMACMDRAAEAIFYGYGYGYEDCFFHTYRDQEIEWPLDQ